MILGSELGEGREVSASTGHTQDYEQELINLGHLCLKTADINEWGSAKAGTNL